MRATWFWRSIGVVAFGLFLASCHQNGTVFAVDTTDDTVDVTPGDGLCADANGDCSLRAAIIEANALPGVEEIALVDDATYELTIPGGLEDQSMTGDLDIRAAVVITGDGTILGSEDGVSVSVDAPSGLTEFDGPNFNGGFHGLEILSGSSVSVRHADFTTASVFVEDGALSVWSSSFGMGWSGGIFAESGKVRLENVSMVGAGAYPRLISARDADVVVVSSTLGRGSISVDGPGSGSIMVQSSALQVNCYQGVTSLGHNLRTRFGGCNFGEDSDIIDLGYPVAGPLADNGGEVLSVALDPFGAAIDGGQATGCTLSGTDARGVPRPHGLACDIGALEIERGADCATPGPGADLHLCDLRSFSFAGLDLSGADITEANLDGVDLTGARLVGAQFDRAHVDRAVFDDADLTDATLVDSIGWFFGDGADFTRADLRRAGVWNAVGADFTDANGREFETWGGASLFGAHIEGADFTNADFHGVNSGGITGTATFSPGTALVNGYIITDFVVIDGVDLSGSADVSLQGARITNSNLTGLRVIFAASATLTGSIVENTDWTGANAHYARLRGAVVVQSDLTDAQFERTDWGDAAVVGVDFTNTNLYRASFHNAAMLLNHYDNTICPSGVNSDDNGGNCDGQFPFGAPAGGGAAVPAEYEGMSMDDFFPSSEPE